MSKKNHAENSARGSVLLTSLLILLIFTVSLSLFSQRLLASIQQTQYRLEYQRAKHAANYLQWWAEDWLSEHPHWHELPSMQWKLPDCELRGKIVAEPNAQGTSVAAAPTRLSVKAEVRFNARYWHFTLAIPPRGSV